MSRVDDLRADYEFLGQVLRNAEGSAAAAIARERRLIGEQLERLEASEESYVDELAGKRSEFGRRPARRRSG